MSMQPYEWQCSSCLQIYDPESIRYTCPQCNDRSPLTMRPDYERLGRGRSPHEILKLDLTTMWRYAPLLPVQSPHPLFSPARFAVGGTPLYPAERLAARFGLRQLWVKDEGRNPTGSLKDRASALVVAKAVELDEPTIVTASSGNAAAALAGCCAAYGKRCVVFVPERTPDAKIAQLLIYGAHVFLVQGNYDDTVRLSEIAAELWGWYCRNTAFNPYTAEGKKTVALEIMEQLDWHAPDALVVPVGDGNILFGIYRGLQDALGMGWITRLPRLIGVQSATAPALYNAWHQGKATVEAAPAQTIADSICVEQPQDGRRVLHAIAATGGSMVTVTDTAILDAMRDTASTTGIFMEPSSATTVAALPALLAQSKIAADERIVLVATGNGLKDVAAAIGITPSPVRIPPSRSALQQYVEMAMG